MPTQCSELPDEHFLLALFVVPKQVFACQSLRTIAELCMTSLQAGHVVCGSYMSPVNDAYHKPELLPSAHRIAMCQLAAAESELIMVDTWEAAQPQAQRSLLVLQHVQQAVQQHYKQAVTSSEPAACTLYRAT